MTNQLARTFPAHRAVLREVREFIRHRAREDEFVDEAEGLVLAVSEAVANAIVHSTCTRVGVTWRCTPDRVEVHVEDDGVFRRRVLMPELDGRGGQRGIPLMMALLDQVSISGGTESRPGTRVKLVKYREA